MDSSPRRGRRRSVSDGGTMPPTYGRYKIEKLIGRGAMGEVFLAHDPEIDRHVALKIFSPAQFVSPPEAEDAARRFRREARAAGRLNHPNTVTIYDVGEDHGDSYIAMEYIEGSSLAEYARKGALLAPDRAIGLVATAARTLAFAHSRQILHRDIKPANLMLTRDGTLKITDFGLAKDFGASVTRAGALIGTPNYMAPELIMSRPGDGRSDLFSLGVVLYELLTGERPFNADSVSAVIYRILHDEPRPLAERAFELPHGVEKVLARVLAKDPAARYQDGEEFAQDLELLLEGSLEDDPGSTVTRPLPALGPDDTMLPIPPPRPASAARGPAPRAASAWWTRRRLALSFVALLGAAVAILLLTTRRPGSPAPPPAAERRVILQGLPQEAEIRVDGRPIARDASGGIVLPARPCELSVATPCAEWGPVRVAADGPAPHIDLRPKRVERTLSLAGLPPGTSVIPTRLDVCREQRVRVASPSGSKDIVLTPRGAGETPDEVAANWAGQIVASARESQAAAPAVPVREVTYRLEVRYADGDELPYDVNIAGCRDLGGNAFECPAGEHVVTARDCKRLLNWRGTARVTARGELEVNNLPLASHVKFSGLRDNEVCEVRAKGCQESLRIEDTERFGAFEGTLERRCRLLTESWSEWEPRPCGGTQVDWK